MRSGLAVGGVVGLALFAGMCRGQAAGAMPKGRPAVPHRREVRLEPPVQALAVQPPQAAPEAAAPAPVARAGALADASSDVRVSAAIELGLSDRSDSEATSALIRQLSVETDERVKRVTAAALGARAAPAAIDALLGVLRSAESPGVRTACASALARAGEAGEGARVAQELAGLRDGERDADVRASIVAALLHLQGDVKFPNVNAVPVPNR